MSINTRDASASASAAPHNGLLSALCARFARRASRSPLALILASAAAAAALAAGALVAGLVIDSDPDKIWVPPGTAAARQEAFFNAAFDPFFRVSQAIISLADAADASTGSGGAAGDGGAAAGALQRGYLQAVLALQQALAATPASDGTLLDDVCYKPIAGRGCIVETPLDFFRSNASVLAQLTPPLVQDALACRHILGQTSIPCLSDIGVPVQPEVVLGGTDCLRGAVPGFNASACGGCGTYARALVLTYLLDSTPAAEQRAAGWERDVFLPLVEAFSAPGLAASYYSQRSVGDALLVVEQQNQGVIFVSYLAMLAYIALALGKFPHPIATRALLGLQGVAIVAVSVLSALGLAAWAGLHITMIVTEVVPFLILAIGVDNMFIISKAFDRNWRGPARASAWRRRGAGATAAAAGGGLSVEDAAVEALREVGPTISAAACCEIMAFGVGITTDVPALQQFCTVAALAVAIGFVLQLTWFLPAVVIDARRQEQRRADVLPCVRLRGGAVRRTLFCDCACGKCAERADDIDGDGDGDDEAVESGGFDSARVAADGSAGDVGSADARDEGLQNGFAEVAHARSDVKALDDGGSAPARSGVVRGVLAEPLLETAGARGATSGGAECCCGVRWRTVNEGRFVRDGCMARYAPLLLAPPARCLVVLAWLGLVATSLLGLPQLRLGLEQQLVLPEGSYLAPYFDQQARLGEAGPPVYLVLQNVNYTHPDTAAAVADFAAAVGGLSRYVVAPVFSWVADFEAWGTPDTAKYIAQNPQLGCPTPLLASNASYAARVAQFIFDIPIESQCCQSGGFCGGQYSTDVKFLWGQPKVSAAAAQAAGAAASHASGEAGAGAEPAAAGIEQWAVEQAGLAAFTGGRPTLHVTKSGSTLSLSRAEEGPLYRSLTSGFDDGGCMVAADGSGAGYVAQRDLERALAASRGGHGGRDGGRRATSLGSHVTLPAAAAIALLPASRAQVVEQAVAAAAARVVGSAPAAAAAPAVEFVPCHVMVSRLRSQHTPLRNQSDFLGAMAHTQSAVQSLQAPIPRVDMAALGLGYGPLAPGAALPPNATGGGGAGASDNEHLAWLPPTDASSASFAYSLFYVYYEQYEYLRGATLNMLAVALAAVFATSLLVTASLPVAAVTCLVVASIVLCLCGFVFALNPPGTPDPFGAGPWGVDINAVSVVNLVTAAGLGVEFVIHVAAAFFASRAKGEAAEEGDEEEGEEGARARWCAVLPRDACSTRSARAARARAAMRQAGASVVTGCVNGDTSRTVNDSAALDLPIDPPT